MSATTKAPKAGGKAGLSLYEIASEFRAMEQMLRDLGHDEQTISDTLEGAEGDLVDKLAAVVAVALSMQAEAEQIKAYVLDRTKARIDRLNKRADGLFAYALDAMVGTQRLEVKQPDLHFRVRENPHRLVIDDEAAIPELFFDTQEIPATTVRTLDKDALKDALKAREQEMRDAAKQGEAASVEPISGAHLERGKRIEVL